MPLLFGTVDGALVYEVQPAASDFDPVQQDRVDTPIFWQLLDDAYAYMEDRDIIEEFWTAMIELGAGDLLQAYIQDATTSLDETPLLSPRRWVAFDLTKRLDFSKSPAPAEAGGRSLTSDRYSYASGDLTALWRTSVDATPHWFALSSEVSERASLRWSYEVLYTSSDRAGACRVGYFGEEGDGGLYSGITRRIDEDTDQAVLYAGHEGTGGTVVLEQGGGVLLPGVRYRIDNEYEAVTATLSCDAWELRALKYTTSVGQTDASTGSLPYVNRVEVPGFDWAGAGVVEGDLVVYEGKETPVTSIAGDQLTVQAYIFPADAAALEFDVRGEVLVASVTLDVEARTGDTAHRLAYFGTSNVRSGDLVDDLYPLQYTTGLGVVVTAWDQQMRGSTSAWAYFDPSSPYRIREVPSLVDKVKNATQTWVGGLDVHLHYPGTGTVLEFQTLPPDRVWAEHVAYDEHLLASIYGRNIGLDGDSTETYKLRLQGLYYAYFRGPARGAIRTGVHLLLGLPVSGQDGVVEELELTYTGALSRIRVAGVDYTFPRTIGTPLSVGDAVSTFQPLCYGVDVVDWTTDPFWFERHANVHELQKYHSFEIAAEADSPDLEALPFALSFLSRIKPTWKQAYFLAVSRHFDDLDISDALEFVAQLELWDLPCDVTIPRYDSYDYQQHVTDWRYDQVEGPSWATTAGTQRHPQNPGVRDWLTDLDGKWDLDPSAESDWRTVDLADAITEFDTDLSGQSDDIADEGDDVYYVRLAASKFFTRKYPDDTQQLHTWILEILDSDGVVVADFWGSNNRIEWYIEVVETCPDPATRYHAWIGVVESNGLPNGAGKHSMIGVELGTSPKVHVWNNAANKTSFAVPDGASAYGYVDAASASAIETHAIGYDSHEGPEAGTTSDSNTSPASGGYLAVQLGTDALRDPTGVWAEGFHVRFHYRVSEERGEPAGSFTQLPLVEGVDGALLSQVGGPGAVSRKYVAASRYITGTEGEVVDGSLSFVDATPGAMDDVQVGARVQCGGQTRLVTGVSGSTLTLKTPFDFSGTGYPWAAVNDAFLRGQIATVVDDNSLRFAETFTGDPGTYCLSLIDLAVMNVYYDWQDENCPEEELEFVATLGAGLFGTTLLPDNFHELGLGNSFIQQFDDAVSDIGPVGPVTERYLCDPRGRWYQIDEVVDTIEVSLIQPIEEEYDGCVLYLSAKAYDGTFDFTNGSASVPCTNDMRGVIEVGDYIQAVPALGTTPVDDNPPVEVLAIDAGDGLTITLAANYPGLTNAGTKVINRGDTTQFPMSQDLPDGREEADVVSQDFTDFFPATGSSMSSTVEEPEP